MEYYRQNKHNKDITTNVLSIFRKVTKNVYVHVLNTKNFPENPNLPYTHLPQQIFKKSQRREKKERSSHIYLKHATTSPKILFLKAKARKGKVIVDAFLNQTLPINSVQNLKCRTMHFSCST